MSKEIIPVERLAQSIRWIRGQKVVLDSDLAALYDVRTANLNKAVKRNAERFPTDFMFQFTSEELRSLRFQIGMSKRRGGLRYLPYALIEQGIAMLSSVLNSERAGERTRFACWRWRPRHRELFTTGSTRAFGFLLRTFRRGRRKGHARRVCSPA
jgi:hypothetical protein